MVTKVGDGQEPRSHFGTKCVVPFPFLCGEPYFTAERCYDLGLASDSSGCSCQCCLHRVVSLC